MRQALPDADYLFVVRPLKDEIPAELRLRRLLKAMLRGYGLRCTLVRAVLPGEDLRRAVTQSREKVA